MKLSPREYAVYTKIMEYLRETDATYEDTLFVTMDSLGDIAEHTDPPFDVDGRWLCVGRTTSVGDWHAIYPDESATITDAMWRLLKVRKEPRDSIYEVC